VIGRYRRVRMNLNCAPTLATKALNNGVGREGADKAVLETVGLRTWAADVVTLPTVARLAGRVWVAASGMMLAR